VRLTPIIEVEPFTMESSHYYYTDRLFSLQLSTLPLLLPTPLAKRHIRRQFLGSCREELDRNAGRLRADFQERLTKSARAFSAAFDAKVQGTRNSLAAILQQAAEAKQRSDTELAARQGGAGGRPHGTRCDTGEPCRGHRAGPEALQACT